MSSTLLVIIGAVADSSFHIKAVTLMHILLYYLCKPTIKNKIVPICMVWHLGTIRQSISFLCSCERDLSYCLICFEIMNVRIFTYITN